MAMAMHLRLDQFAAVFVGAHDCHEIVDLWLVHGTTLLLLLLVVLGESSNIFIHQAQLVFHMG